MTKIKNLWESKFFKGAICTLATIIAVLVIFQAGRFVGFRQAGFAYHMGDNYYQAFEGGPRDGGMMRNNPFGDIPGGHGAVGKIVRINLPSIVISTPDNLEKTILVNNDTSVKRFRNNASTSDFKVGDMVVIIGQPNQDSVIEAKLIRLLPPPPLKATSTNNQSR
jgi:hypothetical protein